MCIYSSIKGDDFENVAFLRFCRFYEVLVDNTFCYSSGFRGGLMHCSEM